jgi:hypothetical protein
MNANLMKMLLAMDMKDKKSGQTLTTNMDMDMWMVKDVPGYDEVKQFYAKYAEAVGVTPEMLKMGRMAMGQPGMSEGMAKMAKEASKLQGTPVYTVTRMMGFGGTGPDGQPVEMPEVKAPTSQEVGDAAATSAVSSALGKVGLGGFGGFGKKKKEPPKEEPKPAAAPAAAEAKPAAQPGQSVMMEMTQEMANFSTSGVDSSKFAVPGGFKEVEHEMKKALREMK